MLDITTINLELVINKLKLFTFFSNSKWFLFMYEIIGFFFINFVFFLNGIWGLIVCLLLKCVQYTPLHALLPVYDKSKCSNNLQSNEIKRLS